MWGACAPQKPFWRRKAKSDKIPAAVRKHLYFCGFSGKLLAK